MKDANVTFFSGLSSSYIYLLPCPVFPVHCYNIGVLGNEEADGEAKKAARPPLQNLDNSQMPDLTAPIFAAFKRMANDKWDERWGKHRHGAYLKLLRKTQPDRRARTNYLPKVGLITTRHTMAREGQPGHDDLFN